MNNIRLCVIACTLVLGCREAVFASSAPLDRPASFASRETGTIQLAAFGGNVSSPWDHVTKAYLTLRNRADLRIFTRLSRQHRSIEHALLREVGAYSYEMRGVNVVGWYVEPARRSVAHVTLRVAAWIPRNPPAP